jgi:hypothetical protein
MAQIVRDERYWDMARAFVRVWMVEMNDALKECGVEDTELRKEICGRAVFEMGNFLDQYWFDVNGDKYYPLLCFTRQFLDFDTDLEEVGEIFAPFEVEYHSFAYDIADWYFDEQQENDESARMGYLDEE